MAQMSGTTSGVEEEKEKKQALISAIERKKKEKAALALQQTKQPEAPSLKTDAKQANVATPAGGGASGGSGLSSMGALLGGVMGGPMGAVAGQVAGGIAEGILGRKKENREARRTAQLKIAEIQQQQGTNEANILQNLMNSLRQSILF